MPKSSNQKLKLMYMKRIFERKTDDRHSLTILQIIEELKRHNITSERKSIYDDIEMLRLYGMDIEYIKSKSTGYYVANRDFELPELKLLVDAVQSSKFITHKKSDDLIRKLEGLTSEYEAQMLQRQVYVVNRIKTVNERIYYNVDEIHSAIAENNKILFKYFEYDLSKRKIFKHGGKKYKISPLSLMWDDENYYMLGFDSEANIVKHYRVDKMDKIEKTEEKRDGLEIFAKLDMAVYSKGVFSMFGGKEETVKLRFKKTLIGVVLDRFGKDIMILKDDDNHFAINATINISSQFFGWLAALGKKVSIISPITVKEEYINHITEIIMQKD